MQKMLRKISLAALVTILMMGLVVTSVQADGTTATRTETVCDTGSYGVQNCHEVVQQIPTHTAGHVNTGIADFNVVIAAVGLVLILSTASYIYTK
ncbi:hypothetical protein BH10PAT2_BH10PAT2_3890 [soil metagenome]